MIHFHSHRRCRARFWLPLLAVALLVPLASGQVARVSIERIVQEALASNPELKFYEAEIAAAKGEQRTAAVKPNPEVEATLGEKRVRSGPVVSDGLAWSVSVRQAFEWSGRIPLRKAIANQQLKLAELGLAQFRAALAARARVAGYRLFAAQEKAAATAEVAARFQALREVLVQRDAAGLTPVLETRIIEATELTLQRKASEAAVAAQEAQLELNQLTGRPWEATMPIASGGLSFGAPPDLGTLLASARANNFDLLMRQAELEQQGFRVSLARNEQMPAVSVGAYVSGEKAADRETQFGLGVSLPLPLRQPQAGRVATEEARKVQAETSLLVMVRDVERQVAEQAHLFRAKRDEIGRWRPDSVQRFQEAATLADQHYRVGAVGISVYVELQKQYLEAVEAMLDTRREALEAGLELQRLMGHEFGAVREGEP
jgi:cobalt-zinc-cadmium efflux system outer membrane protein